MWIRWALRGVLTGVLALLFCAWAVSYKFEFAVGFGGDRPFFVPTVHVGIEKGRFSLDLVETTDYPPQHLYIRIGKVPSVFDDWHPPQFCGIGGGVLKINISDRPSSAHLWDVRFRTIFFPMWLVTAITALLVFLAWRKPRKRSGPAFPVEPSNPITKP